MVSNTDTAIARSAEQSGASIADYTVAPIHLTRNQKGAHQWLIEFEKMPVDLELFQRTLDYNLKIVNDDYAAKRYKDIALDIPKIDILPKGTFNKWLKDKQKLGGQNKVPRLSSQRNLVDELLKMIQLEQSYV